MAISNDELKDRFAYHAISDADTLAKMDRIRQGMATAAALVVDLAPEGREQSLAITALEEAKFWANAGIAKPSRNQPTTGGNNG
jgi:hypothetical protein